MPNPLKWLWAFLRRTSPNSAEASNSIRLGPSTSGVYVTSEEQALAFSGVWACCKVIAETLAGLPWDVCRRGADGTRAVLENHPISYRLNVQPNPEITAFLFRERMAIWALLWGDAYAEIERDAIGRPVYLWPIEPHRVTLERNALDQLVYRVRNPGTEDSNLAPGDVFHVRGLGPSGLAGYYVVALFREAIALGLATERQAASFFGNAATPSGFLKHPGRITVDQAAELLETFENRHLGPSRRHRVGILQGGLEYESVGATPEDSQLESTRTFQILEACRIFRVPPHKVAELSRATYSNIAEQETAFGRDTIAPWCKRFEQEADAKLFPPRTTQLFYTRHNLNAIMRGDPKGRAEVYEILQRLGALSTNEIRALEELDPIGPDGDKRLVPSNFTTLEKIGEDPEPPPAPVAPPPADGAAPPGGDEGEEPEGDDEATERAARAFREPVRDFTAWVSRKVRGELGAAAKRHHLGTIDEDYSSFEKWLNQYTADTSELLAGRLRPLVAAWCELRNIPAAFASETASRLGYTLAVHLANGSRGTWAATKLDAYGINWARATTEWVISQLRELEANGNGQEDET